MSEINIELWRKRWAEVKRLYYLLYTGESVGRGAQERGHDIALLGFVMHKEWVKTVFSLWLLERCFVIFLQYSFIQLEQVVCVCVCLCVCFSFTCSHTDSSNLPWKALALQSGAIGVQWLMDLHLRWVDNPQSLILHIMVPSASTLPVLNIFFPSWDILEDRT